MTTAGTTQTLQGWLEDLGRTETAAAQAYVALRDLRAVGLATADDYAQYETLRSLLFSAQNAMVAVARGLLTQFAPAYLDRLPTPQRLPAVTAGAVDPWPGLGNPALVVAAVLVALFGIATIAWLLTEVVDAGLATYEAMARVRARAEQYQRLLHARQVAYQACLQSGAPADACAGRATTVAPSPSDAELQIDTAPRGTSSSSKFWWGAAFVVGAAGLGYWLWTRYAVPSAAPAVRGLGAPHRVADLDGSKSRYNLEVQR